MINFILASGVTVIVHPRGLTHIGSVKEATFVSIHAPHLITPQYGVTPFNMEAGTSAFS